MKLKVYLHIILLLCSQFICAQSDFDFIPNLIQQSDQDFYEKYLSNSKKYRIQIIYTQINRDSSHKPICKDYFYRIEENEYFYPASTVKLPFAIFALEQLECKHLSLNDNFVYSKDSLSFLHDIKNKSYHSINQYLNQALIVSDNQAANVLFEIATPSYINLRMKELGFLQSRITQRFAKTDTVLSRITKGFFLTDSNFSIKYHQLPIYWNKTHTPHFSDCKIGLGQLLNGKTINKPYDFSYDNYVSLPEIHDLLKLTMLYDSGYNGLLISQKNLNLLRKTLSMYPRECRLNSFKPENGYYDACRKYLLFGTENEQIDSNIRVFNKVGLAYGFVTDIAYIVDYEKGVEFMLSAVIYANEDNIVNDGKYNYESIAFPFMKKLGKIFYEYEKQRVKQFPFNGVKENY